MPLVHHFSGYPSEVVFGIGLYIVALSVEKRLIRDYKFQGDDGF